MVDARFSALRAQGYTGSTSDMLLAWLIYNGATAAKTLQDAWALVLAAYGFPINRTAGFARNDAWYALLGTYGYAGTLDDRERAFWIAGGILANNLIINGTFSIDSNWTKNTGWTISGGSAIATAAAVGSPLVQPARPFVAGTVYRVTYTVSELTGGQVRCNFSGGTAVNGTTRTANGTYVQDLTAVAGNTEFRIAPVTSALTCKIDNISVVEITWLLITGLWVDTGKWVDSEVWVD